MKIDTKIENGRVLAYLHTRFCFSSSNLLAVYPRIHPIGVVWLVTGETAIPLLLSPVHCCRSRHFLIEALLGQLGLSQQGNVPF